MALPTFPWPSTAASIPSGWERDTRFDGVYVIGADASGDGGGTGGASTHTHPDDSTHTHTVTVIPESDVQGVGGTNKTIKGTHTHAANTSNATAVAFTATSNDPPYYEVIFIKPTTALLIASGMVGFWDTGSLPSDWNECDGAGGRPDLRNKFLKGAAAGGNSGATGGSLDEHSHVSDHTHAAKNTAISVGSINAGGSDTTFAGPHYHSVTLLSHTASVQNADGQPPFKKLLAAYYSGAGALDTNLIGLWPDTVASIPANWNRVTGQDTYFLKIASGSGEIAATGGANQHSHTCSAHNHNASESMPTSTLERDQYGSPTIGLSYAYHIHALTIGNDTSEVPNNTSGNNYPPYVKAILVKYAGSSFIPRLPLMGVG